VKDYEMKNYDENNIFNKILNNEVECEKIQENQENLSFNDINKQAPVHVLTIPKNKYSNFNSFVENASDKEISSFFRSVLEVAEKMKVKDSGFRIIINCGPDSNQEVPHLHAHILGGKNLGSLLG
jgi:histidine triad (HIT) family protein